jgi:hypothetical protein
MGRTARDVECGFIQHVGVGRRHKNSTALVN